MNKSITLRLTEEEHEWLRRCAHWHGTSMAGLLKSRLHEMVTEEGYLRPPDDEPQDFGDEKVLMQWVVAISEGR